MASPNKPNINPMRNIAILGSTGSIGRSALEVVARFPDRFRITCLTANRNVDLLRRQVDQFRPRAVVIQDERNASLLRKSINGSTEVFAGDDGLRSVVRRDDIDIVFSSLVGFAGLQPTILAIEAGKDIALANKETLVVGGELIMQKVREKGVRLLPVDSEHSAILQCLQGEDINSVDRHW
jgi:1-deoxy-D-xylulose-5-phosphate reductoisomerase